MKTLIFLLIASLIVIAAEKTPTQEDKIQTVQANMVGSTIRHQKGDISKCSETYKDEQLAACEDGYKKTDKMLSSPAGK